VLGLARRLPAADQARLVAQLTPTIAAALADAAENVRPIEDPWATLARLREEFRALGPVSPSATEELIASRR
jgi:hypothetical protein